jgi:hypothetical protein
MSKTLLSNCDKQQTNKIKVVKENILKLQIKLEMRKD